MVVGDLAAFEPDILEDRMQLDGVEPQVMGKPVDGAGRSSSSRCAASVLKAASCRLAAPGRAQRPEASVEGDGVGDDRVEARELLGACNHLDQERRREERLASSTKRSRSEPTAAPRPATTFAT